ncbi:MAG: UUP1 family membrane protein [Myxococcota bacterium]
MNRSVILTGAVLVLSGGAFFLYKLVGLGLPVFPTNPEGVWQVELLVAARGQGSGVVRAALPSNDSHQIVFDETSSSDGLSLAIDHDGPGRIGVWTGKLDGIHRIAYTFRVRLTQDSSKLPGAPVEVEIPKPIRERYLKSSADAPADAKPIKDLLQELQLPPPDDPAGQLRTLFAYVDHDIATETAASSDALLTLAEREGAVTGKARLLVTLLRAAGLPARVVAGLKLEERGSPDEMQWVECWVADRWISVSPTGEFFAERPQDLLQLRYDGAELLETAGLLGVDRQVSALRERLGPRELANMMIPQSPVFGFLSLYSLPLPAQKALRVLLLLPLGALVVSLFRNIIGLRTFGTFMPILVGLAMRETSLWLGLIMVSVVIGVGVVTRRLLDGLRLLVVPRISFLLCLTILCVVGLALLGEGLGSRDFFSGVVFPIIVLTMLIERFSLVLAEEGFRTAMNRSLLSILIAVATYPIFRSTFAEHLMFGFPELVLVVMGLLVWIGGYMGFRLTDFLRFRVLLKGSAREEIPSELLGLGPAPQSSRAAVQKVEP